MGTLGAATAAAVGTGTGTTAGVGSTSTSRAEDCPPDSVGAEGVGPESERELRCCRTTFLDGAALGACAEALRPRDADCEEDESLPREAPPGSEPDPETSAHATLEENAAAPTPRATANPPTRPTNFDAPMTFPPECEASAHSNAPQLLLRAGFPN